MSEDGFFLGGEIDLGTGERSDERTSYDRRDLTTHGVIVGMTGSGKTGLGIIYLEEALLAGVPCLILDPKGDMTNLLLTFPDLAPADFVPWIDVARAQRDEKSVAEVAAATADLWRNGLGGWGLDGGRIQRLRDSARFTIYTPGSAAGVPLDVIGSLSAPPVDFDSEAEALRDEIEGFVSGLLGLVGIESDPISSREHILLSTLIEHSWRQGRDLDIAGLVMQVQDPPLRKLGVFDVDTFFPEKDRLALAMRLNGLIASPAFASWLQGPDLDIQSLLFGPDGRPAAAILYLAHLSEEERQFIVTLTLSKVVTWMRSQAGTGDLRALIYMDEVFGFVPPTAQPPAKKPILTLLKQARAFGVGMLLSTQNPVDLDYKAMSNAGTWAIGRLQTERDKARILEALQSARGDSDTAKLDALISGLDKRQFLLHNTREEAPEIFTTRWAMSYLRGPLTKEQVEQLMTGHPDRRPDSAGDATVREAEPRPDAPSSKPPPESPRPQVAAGVPEYFLDPAAPWGSDVGAVPGGTRLVPAIAARVGLLYDDAPAKLQHQEEWEAIFSPLQARFDATRRRDVDYDDRDFRAEPPAAVTWDPGEVPVHSKRYFTSVESAIKNHLDRHRTIEIFKNPPLGLYSRIGESRQQFERRCDAAAQDEADRKVAGLRDRLDARLRRLRSEVDSAARKAGGLQSDVDSTRQDEVLDGIGGLLGGLLGGRERSRSMSRAASKRADTRRAEQRLGDARARLQDKIDALEALEEESLREVAEISDEWEAKAATIELVEIGLEKSDISVMEVALIWVPTD